MDNLALEVFSLKFANFMKFLDKPSGLFDNAKQPFIFVVAMIIKIKDIHPEEIGEMVSHFKDLEVD